MSAWPSPALVHGVAAMKSWPEWMRRLPRCAATSKVAHPDEASADRHLRRLARTGRPGKPGKSLTAYHCRHCLGWHVGHTSWR